VLVTVPARSNVTPASASCRVADSGAGSGTRRRFPERGPGALLDGVLVDTTAGTGPLWLSEELVAVVGSTKCGAEDVLCEGARADVDSCDKSLAGPDIDDIAAVAAR
jgi:hypothetical protein